MSRKTIYCPHNYLFFGILLFILLAVIGLVFVGLLGVAFADVGFSPFIIVLIVLILVLSLRRVAFSVYVRPHMALSGKTPSEMCGMKVEGENKWLTLIQNAGRKTNA